MPGWNSFSYVFGPLVAAGLITFFVFFLRWAFRRGASVVAAPARPGRTEEYGILTPVASPGTYVEGEMIRRRLEDAGIRCNLAQTLDGPRVMVWPADEERARAVISR
ncbi:MAG: hypothetical protein ACKOAF_08775 [Actinomycetes bacterium]